MNVSKIINNLMVTDVRASVDYYESMLGFELVMAVPEGTEDVVDSMEDGVTYGFAVVKNSEVEIMFQSECSIRTEFPNLPECSSGSHAIFYMQVTGIDELFERLEDKVELVKGLYEAFYGIKEFYIKDPDGYILGFAEKP